MQIERLLAKDFEEALDFINMVFSMAHCPFDFVKFLPRLYKPTDECMSRNLVVRENGRIRAFVGMYPDIVQVGETTLKLGGIGAVSSHPNDRGKGWMKLLMEAQINEMMQEEIDLSFLVGLRQRYMYFGYEKTGALLEYKLNKSNMKHDKESGELPPIKLVPMQADDLQRIRKAKELHDAEPLHCLRPLEEFYLFLLTGNMQPWAALGPDGAMVGYLTCNAERNRIPEIFADNATALAGMVRGWFAQQNIQETAVILPSWAQASAQCLGGMAEDVHVAGSGNWRIFNWHKVVGALLRMKRSQQRLADGALCIGISEYGNLKISISGEQVTCDRTSERADVEWDAFTATRVMFGHVPSVCVTAMPKSIQPLTASWFPLPLSWIPQNHV